MIIIPRININYNFKEFVYSLKNFFKKNIRQTFEEKFQQSFRIGKSYAVSSARGALYLILKSLDLKPETEIIVPEYTFFAIPKIVLSMGFKCKYAKVNLDTLCLEPSLLEFTDKTRVVIVEHIFGQSVEIEKIKKKCLENNVILIEDCAQSCGCKYDNKYVGSFGDFAYFSFAYGKNITTLNGGMIVINNSKYLDKLENIINNLNIQSKKQTIVNVLKGIIQYILTKKIFFKYSLFIYLKFLAKNNSKKYIDSFLENQSIKPEKNINIFLLSNIQSAFGVIQLDKIEQLNLIRKKNAEKIKSELSSEFFFKTNLKSDNTYNCFPIKVDDSSEILIKLILKGIDARLDWMSWLPKKKNKLNIIYLPNHPGLNETDINHIIKVMKEIM